MSYVEYDLILCIIKYGKKRHGKFYRTEVGRQMSAVRRNGGNDLLTKFPAKLNSVGTL